MRRLGVPAMAAALLATTAPQAAQAHDKTGSTLLGAGLGMLGGAILSDGDPWVTVAGGAAGGVIGNLSAKDRDHHRWRDDDDDDDDRYWRRRRDHDRY